MVSIPSLLEAESVSWGIIMLYSPCSFFLTNTTSGQAGRMLEHMNPGLTLSCYFYVPVTSASADPANSASVQPLRNGLTKRCRACSSLQSVPGSPASGRSVSLGLITHTHKLITPCEIPAKLGMFRNARAGILKTLLSCSCLWEECRWSVAGLQENCHC